MLRLGNNTENIFENIIFVADERAVIYIINVHIQTYPTKYKKMH
jgi:hypothetical protein